MTLLATACRYMLLNALDAMEVPYDDLFSCPLCGSDPKVLILDCKAMGYQRAFSTPYHRPLAKGCASPFTM
jgi:hypothetical protein